jgi:hypothetical protein
MVDVLKDRIAIWGESKVVDPTDVETFRRVYGLSQKKFSREQILALAILLAGRDDYLATNRAEKRRKDAEEWIFTKSSSPWLFSFDNTCGILGLDPSYVRGKLARERFEVDQEREKKKKKHPKK